MPRRRAVLGLLGAAAVVPALPRPARAQTLVPITLATLTNDSATTALYAARSGMFRKAGLDVTLQVLPGGAACAAAVVGGSAQFGISSLVNIISAHVNGVPLVLIAPAGVDIPKVAYSRFVVRKDSTIANARDLNGKTIGTPGLKDLDTVAVSNWVDRNGGDSTTLKFVEMSGSVAAAAVEEGRIDGVDLNTPILAQALDTGKVRILADIFEAIAPRFANTGWFATVDYIAQNRDTVDRFTKTMSAASAYCNAHPADTVAMVAQSAKLDPTVVARMPRIEFAEYLRAGEIQPLIDVTYRYKVISKSFDAREMISPAALKPPG